MLLATMSSYAHTKHRQVGAGAYARGRLAVFSIEMLAVWAILGVVSAASLLLLQPRSWTVDGAGTAAESQRAWRQDFADNGYAVEQLPRLQSSFLPSEPRPDLATAVLDADIVVVGSVVRLDFDDPYITRVTFMVEQYLKGEAPTTSLLVYQTVGGPVPGFGSHYVSGQGLLYEEAWAPYLVSGDRAVLLLQDNGDGSPAWPQDWSGVYRVELGRITAPAANLFAAEVEGLRLDDLLRRIRFVLSADDRPT